MSVSCRMLDETPGIQLLDPDTGRRVRIETDSAPVVEDIDEGIDSTEETVQRVQCSALHFPEIPTGHVRDEYDNLMMTVAPGDQTKLENESYLIELHASVKLNLKLRGPARLDARNDALDIILESPSDVTIAAHSYHQDPRATITTTDAPEDILRAISYFGGSLRTTTTERSFPSLRGHPPLLDRGDSLDIPTDLPTSNTGIQLELPPTYESAIAAAGVAYYLGVECRPGKSPCLRTDEGFTYPLHDTDIHRSLNRLLKRVFLMDVITRTDGLYPVSLPEREAIEPLVDAPLSELYLATPAERLESYFEVPEDIIEAHLPTWGMAASVPSSPRSIPLLPHLAFRLAELHPTATATSVSQEELRGRLLETRVSESAVRGDDIRSTPLVQPAETDAVEHVWFGSDLPIGASLGVEAAYSNTHSSSSGDTIDVTVVVGAGKIGTEEAASVTDVYRDHTYLPFSVTVHQNPTMNELASILKKSCDFLHYIGHVDHDGFRCSDGHLHTGTIDHVGTRAFFLNSCNSIALGKALVERGSLGGIATFGDVLDAGAGRLGVTVARLLESGFPLYPAFMIARDHHFVGLNYLVVGDGSVDIAQSQHGPPVYCVATSERETESIELTIHVYLPQEAGMGILALPYVGQEHYHLPPGELTKVFVNESELADYLSRYGGPVQLDGRMLWCEANLNDLRGTRHATRSTDHPTTTGSDDTEL